MDKLIVTRHEALVEYLIQIGLVDKDTKHLARAEPIDLKGKHVFGVLPTHLACHTGKYTEVQLGLPSHLRITELTVENVKFYIGKIRTYIITEVE